MTRDALRSRLAIHLPPSLPLHLCRTPCAVPAHDVGRAAQVAQRPGQQGQRLQPEAHPARGLLRGGCGLLAGPRAGWVQAAAAGSCELPRTERCSRRARRALALAACPAGAGRRRCSQPARSTALLPCRFFAAQNLVRGRGLFCRSIMKSQMASPAFTPGGCCRVPVWRGVRVGRARRRCRWSSPVAAAGGLPCCVLRTLRRQQAPHPSPLTQSTPRWWRRSTPGRDRMHSPTCLPPLFTIFRSLRRAGGGGQHQVPGDRGAAAAPRGHAGEPARRRLPACGAVLSCRCRACCPWLHPPQARNHPTNPPAPLPAPCPCPLRRSSSAPTSATTSPCAQPPSSSSRTWPTSRWVHGCWAGCRAGLGWDGAAHSPSLAALLLGRWNVHCCHQCCCCTAAAIDAGALLTRCRLALSPPCQVVHELLPLEILLLLLETPSDDGVEVAVDFLKEVGAGPNGRLTDKRFRACALAGRCPAAPPLPRLN